MKVVFTAQNAADTIENLKIQSPSGFDQKQDVDFWIDERVKHARFIFFKILPTKVVMGREAPKGQEYPPKARISECMAAIRYVADEARENASFLAQKAGAGKEEVERLSFEAAKEAAWRTAARMIGWEVEGVVDTTRDHPNVRGTYYCS